MQKRAKDLGKDIACPVCRSQALYKYGTVREGLQRVRCVVCGRQFIPGHERLLIANRPLCPLCGKSMHLYRWEGNGVRFRCSDYPGCKAYIKLVSQEVPHRGMLRA